MVCSKGKRDKKRKRKGTMSVAEFNPAQDLKPGVPETLNSVTIGFNSTTRELEQTVHGSIRSSLSFEKLHDTSNMRESMTAEQEISANIASTQHRPLMAVFAPYTEKPPVLFAHLPILIKTASLMSPELPAIRLVTLPRGAEAQLSKALGIPRVGLIALRRGTPAASELEEFISINVPAVEIPWLEEAEAGIFLPTEIDKTRTSPRVESKQDRRNKNRKSSKQAVKATS